MSDVVHPAPAFGPPPIRARIKAQPEHFIVRERLGFSADGEGEHVLLTVRKRGANTHWVAKQLARHARVDARDVGYSGLKDRHAVTEQAFTVPARHLAPEAWLQVATSEFAVIGAARHRRKLKRGAHKTNEFEITLSDVVGDMAALQERLPLISRHGVPNYFGPQRFGRDANNLQLARRWMEQGEVIGDRFQRGFALSAARAAIFNAVLEARVRRGDWNQLLSGDVANLQGSNSLFAVDSVDESLAQRCADFDIHPTGPLWGGGELRTRCDVAVLEAQIAAEFQGFSTGLVAAGLCHERRALRSSVQNLTWTLDATQLILRFTLSRGSFATAVVAELLGPDAGELGEDEDA